MELKTTLGQLINPEVLSDHFDHYGAPSLMHSTTYDNNHNHNQPGRTTSSSYPYNSSDRRTDISSPIKETVTEDEFVEAPTEFITTVPKTQAYSAVSAPGPPKSNSKRPTTLSRDDTYLCSIENDVRKRISYTQEPSRTQDDIALTTQAKNKQSRQSNLSQAISKQMGSLPDITSLKDLESMPKEDLMRLSAARREEIRKLLEEQERRNAGDITVLAGDVKVNTKHNYIITTNVKVSMAPVIMQRYST